MVSTDTANNLLGALSLSALGATPQRWFVDWSHFEPGALLPHPHIYVVNPYETSAQGPMNVWCITCLAQFNIHIIPQDRCTGLSHHIHTDIGDGSVVAECCHCGLHINAIKEQPTLPRSLISRIEKARNPKSTNLEAPHFHDTLALLIRVLTDAVKSPDESAATSPGSINVESKVFRNQIGFDEASQEFFKCVRFNLIDKRYYPPENTPENTQFLNRCRFQLELVLMEAKQHQPGMFQGLKNLFGGYKVEYAYESIFRRLDVTEYSRDPRAKVLDLTSPTTLNAEKISEAKLLGCLSDMCDDLIIDAFRTQVSHDPSNAHLRVDGLSRIQKARQSDKLHVEIICKRSEGIVTHEELRRAYRDFEIPNEGVNISNEIVLGLIRASLHTNSKENLKIIANARNDPELNRLVEELSTDFAPVDGDLLEYYTQNPVGLSNIGNTCYLNSLLQYIYTVKDIRETVLNMELFVENEDAPDWKGKVVDGRSLSQSYVAAAKELARELRKLFAMMESAKARSVTPSNRLVELLLPPEEDDSAPNGNDQSMHHGGQKSYQFFRQQDVSETLAILMAKLNAAFKPISTPDNKPEDRFDSLFHARAHRKSMETNKETGKEVIERIPEDFSTLLLNVVEEDITMEELIDEYFEPHEKDAEHVKKESNENNENHEGIGDSLTNQDQLRIPPRRHIAVTEFPPVLQIQLMRTHFNRSHMTSYKSNARVSIPKRLHMDQYLESSHEENANRIKRIRLWKEERTRCRHTLNKIKLEREIAIELKKFEEIPAQSDGQEFNSTSALQPEVQPATQSATQPETQSETQPEVQPELQPELQPAAQPETQEYTLKEIPPEVDVLEIETITFSAPGNPVTNGHVEGDEAAEEEQLAKIHDLTAKIQEESMDLGQSEYNLHAVFHHEGSAEFGHYWVYIVDDQAEELRWLKYSDDRIEVAQESEVLNGIQGSNACFCVYTRSKSDKVQTVWRCIAE